MPLPKDKQKQIEYKEKMSVIAKNKGYGLWMKDKKLSEHTKLKISNSLKGKIPKYIPDNKGIKKSEEHKSKIRLSMFGRKVKEETKIKISKNSPRYWLGKKLNQTHVQKLSMSHIGKKQSKETCLKISYKNKGRKRTIESCKKISVALCKEKHYRWNPNRDLVKKNKDGRNDCFYKDWRKKVWLRDKFSCKIDNPECSGKIVAHHIKRWADYPELRYQLNNGITLCHAHHPRKVAEEKRLEDFFKSIVSVSKE